MLNTLHLDPSAEPSGDIYVGAFHGTETVYNLDFVFCDHWSSSSEANEISLLFAFNC